MILLVVGRTYRTRNGQKAWIRNAVETPGPFCEFAGTVTFPFPENPGNTWNGSWRADGRYNAHESPHDLIAEWTDPIPTLGDHTPHLEMDSCYRCRKPTGVIPSHLLTVDGAPRVFCLNCQGIGWDMSHQQALKAGLSNTCDLASSPKIELSEELRAGVHHP